MKNKKKVEKNFQQQQQQQQKNNALYPPNKMISVEKFASIMHVSCYGIFSKL